MRLFVSEYLSCGAWPEDRRAESLSREGRAMLAAVLEDFARLPDCRVVTTWDGRLGLCDFAGVDVHVVHSPAGERRLFERLAAECDATYVIAPEFEGILLDRCRLVEAVGGRWIGPSPECIALCSDKLRLFEHLREHDLPTIATAPLTQPSPADADFPLVIKPRDGAGSQDVLLMADREEWNLWSAATCRRFSFSIFRPLQQRRQVATFRESQNPKAATGRRTPKGPLGSRDLPGMILQPYIPGEALSVGVIGRGTAIDVFPTARQRLSRDGRFRYRGGRLPVRNDLRGAIESLVRRACETLPGLAGYVGFDLLVPHGRSERPLIVEINPRLTTSYLGYRALAEENLAHRILIPDPGDSPISWRSAQVVFRPDGRLRRVEQRSSGLWDQSGQPCPPPHSLRTATFRGAAACVHPGRRARLTLPRSGRHPDRLPDGTDSTDTKAGLSRMAEGTIKKVTDKGFGFIDTEQGGDIFFHMSNVVGEFDDLREGQRVSFTEGQGPKGPRAENVRPL